MAGTENGKSLRKIQIGNAILWAAALIVVSFMLSQGYTGEIIPILAGVAGGSIVLIGQAGKRNS